MTPDEKISCIVDLIAHSQDPLMIRLYTAYRTTNSDVDNASCSEIIVPVTTLPTSFSGYTTSGDKFDLEANQTIIDDMFPLCNGNTKVCLQIVCLNMSRSPLDDYVLNENFASSASE